MVSIFHYLPEVYKSFFSDFFLSNIPEETLSSCQDCAMCDKSQGFSTNSDLFFNEKTKCCTYHPTVPNFLVGGILSDQDKYMEGGRQTLSEIIKKRVGVVPFGIRPSTKYKLLFKASKDNSFGKAYSLVCPFFDDNEGNCSVWKFRASVCSTWFCKTVTGKDGKEFWDSVCEYLIFVEQNLSHFVLKTLGFDGQFIMSLDNGATLTLEDMDEHVDETTYKDQWLHWYGREEEFYITAFRIVEKIDHADLKNIMGFQGVLHLDRLKQKRKMMLAPAIAPKLRRNPELTVYRNKDKYQLVNDTCNVVISKKLYDIIEIFDGTRSTEAINQSLRQQRSCFIGDKLLIKLYQYGILI